MSDIDELAQSIGGVAVKIDAAVSEAVDAAQEAEDAAAVAEMIGSGSLTDGLLRVKEELEALGSALRSASDQAVAVQALTMQVGHDSAKAAAGAAVQIPPATTDPAGVPSNAKPTGGAAERKPKKVGTLRRMTTNTAKRVEDVQDVVDQAQEGVDSLTGWQTRPPEPPEVTSTSTQSPSSSSNTSGAPAHGAEASTVAGSIVAVGVFALAAKEIRRRGGRMVRTPKQFPSERRSSDPD